MQLSKPPLEEHLSRRNAQTPSITDLDKMIIGGCVCWSEVGVVLEVQIIWFHQLVLAVSGKILDLRFERVIRVNSGHCCCIAPSRLRHSFNDNVLVQILARKRDAIPAIQADLILCSLPQKPITAFRTGGRAYGPVLEVERMVEKR